MDVLSMKALMAGLLSWVSLYTGYEVPGKVPDIVFANHEKMARLACQEDCPALGFFHPSRVIYLDIVLKPETNLCARSVLVHELVHVMQHDNGSFYDYDAHTRWILREKEALIIQKKFLAKHNRMHLFDRHLRLKRTSNGAEVRAGSTDWRLPLQTYFGRDC